MTKTTLKRILIDASHDEACRVAVVSGDALEEFDYESSAKRSAKGDVCLARVSRVEPSLQAAFVDFGSGKDGFLAFNEIHPDYFRIPVEDQKALVASLAPAQKKEDSEKRSSSRESSKKYKIQEVIQKRQLLLVQVVKDERGNKGAALTTYLSFPGRYCVLMPNTAKGGGISKKITDSSVRKRLRGIMDELEVQEGTGLILRTAGIDRKKIEIKRDYDYLKKMWEDIKSQTVESTAPALIYQEGDLIQKTLRDTYSRDIDEVLVEGENGYRHAKKIMGKLTPSHVKKIRLHKESAPLFQYYGVEEHIADIHTPTFQLPSGGYLVFGTTEALTSIDVNSGKSTGERHIEETALKTNLEAAQEIARQIRLRDIGGLVVIDFIDMDQGKHKAQVEQCLENALKLDRARTEVGTISPFGLLEMSRQRLKPSLTESINQMCTVCQGTGSVPSTESLALRILRELEQVIDQTQGDAYVFVAASVAFYLFNKKRDRIEALEKNTGHRIFFEEDIMLAPSSFRIEPQNPTKKAASKRAASGKKAGTPSQQTKASPSSQKKKGQPAAVGKDKKNELNTESDAHDNTPQKKSGLRQETEHNASESDNPRAKRGSYRRKQPKKDAPEDITPQDGKEEENTMHKTTRDTRLKVVSSSQRFRVKSRPKGRATLKVKTPSSSHEEELSASDDTTMQKAQIAPPHKESTPEAGGEKAAWWKRLLDR